MRSAFILLAVIGIISKECLATKAEIPNPTGFGTVECKKWPSFYLQNYNPFDHTTYLQSFGLDDIQPKADVTIVGLYFADSDESLDAILYQDRIGYSLSHDYEVHNVALNYYAPKACMRSKPCQSSWGYRDYSCTEYIGGCSPDDERLEVDNWQFKFTNVSNTVLLQDTYWIDAWERFGGGEGDLFIYDSEGRLFAVWCTETNAEFMTRCTHVYKGGEMLSEASYKDVKTTAEEAAEASASRCAQFDDDYYGGYTDAYYYYYYGVDDDNDDDAAASEADGEDSEAVDDKKVGDDDTKVKDDDYDDDDDMYYQTGQFHLGFRNSHHKRKGGIPTAAYASILAVSVLLVSLTVIYVRWYKQNALVAMASRAHSGTTKFSRLQTVTDDDRTFQEALQDESYGSL